MVRTRAQTQHALKGGPPIQTMHDSHLLPMANAPSGNQIEKPPPSPSFEKTPILPKALGFKDKKGGEKSPTVESSSGVKLEKLYHEKFLNSAQKKRKEIDNESLRKDTKQDYIKVEKEDTPQKKSLRPNGRGKAGGIRGTSSASKDYMLPLVLQPIEAQSNLDVKPTARDILKPRMIIDLSRDSDPASTSLTVPDTFTLDTYKNASPYVLNRIFDSSDNLLQPDTHGEGDLSVEFGSKTSPSLLNKLNRYTLIAILGEWYCNSIKEDGFMLDHSFDYLKDLLVSFQKEKCWDVNPIKVKKEWADKYRRKEYKMKGIVSDPNDNPFSLYANLLTHENSKDFFVFYHSLSSTTDSLVIKSWAPRVLVQIIQERAKTHELFLPLDILHQFQAHILRKIVFDIQQDIGQNREKTILFSKTPVSQGTFSDNTKNWEIESFSFHELNKIFWKFMKQSGCELLNKDPEEVTANDLFSTLIEIRDKMKMREIDIMQVCVQLDASTESTKSLIQAMLTDVEHVEDFDKENFILSKSTENTLICTWSPYLLSRFIEMWNVKGKLSKKIQNIEALPAQYLRRIVIDIRDEMIKLDSNLILHEEGIYYSTINATTAGWELDTFTFDELKMLLRSAAHKVGKYFQLESLTHASTRNNLFDILHSEDFRKKDHEVNKTFHASTHVSQQMIDKFFNQRKTAVKTLYTLSKDTVRAEACTWPPLVYVNMLISMTANISQAEKYNYTLLSSHNLRSQILTKLKELQENQLPETHKVKDERKGFF